MKMDSNILRGFISHNFQQLILSAVAMLNVLFHLGQPIRDHRAMSRVDDHVSSVAMVVVAVML